MAERSLIVHTEIPPQTHADACRQEEAHPCRCICTHSKMLTGTAVSRHMQSDTEECKCRYVSICVSMCLYKYVCVSVCVSVSVWKCMCPYMSVYGTDYTFLYACVFMCICVYMSVLMSMCVPVSLPAYTCIYECLSVCMLSNYIGVCESAYVWGHLYMPGFAYVFSVSAHVYKHLSVYTC